MADNELCLATGEIVFVKIKGSRHWPAAITDIILRENKSPKFHVNFFGENTTAEVSKSSILHYYKNIQTYGIPLTESYRNKKFNLALQEAKLAFEELQMQKLNMTNQVDKLDLKLTHTKLPEETLTSDPKDKISEVCSKIQNLQDTEDLETSLTLAAEVGSALLTDNNKLRQDILDLTLKNSKLSQKVKENKEMQEIQLQSKIEELEIENENLSDKVLKFHKILNETEQKISKQDYLQKTLLQTFEEQDREKETIIASCQKEINELRNCIKKLKSNNIEPKKPKSFLPSLIDSETQTRIIDTPTDSHPSNVLLQLTQLKTRQDQMEQQMKLMQEQLRHQQTLNHITPTSVLQNTPAPRKSALTTSMHPLSSKKGLEVKKNHLSVSLQVKKHCESSTTQIKHINRENQTNSDKKTVQHIYRENQPNSDIKTAQSSESETHLQKFRHKILTPPANSHNNKFKITIAPPTTATKLDPSETYQTFFQKQMKLMNDQSQHLNKTIKHTEGRNPIDIEEINIKNLFHELHNNTKVGFAHCISKDLDSPKHMSRGVAVAFKDMFGQPQASDLASSHLTVQTVKDGASVFGLLTKEKFFQKPTETDYNTAFHQLTKNFKQRNLHLLICPPMGCVRDQRPPEHFIKNLIEFQNHTGAKIIVASLNEDSPERPLCNGLTHLAFMTKLRELTNRKKKNDTATTEEVTNNSRRSENQDNFLGSSHFVIERHKPKTAPKS